MSFEGNFLQQMLGRNTQLPTFGKERVADSRKKDMRPEVETPAKDPIAKVKTAEARVQQDREVDSKKFSEHLDGRREQRPVQAAVEDTRVDDQTVSSKVNTESERENTSADIPVARQGAVKQTQTADAKPSSAKASSETQATDVTAVQDQSKVATVQTASSTDTAQVINVAAADMPEEMLGLIQATPNGAAVSNPAMMAATDNPATVTDNTATPAQGIGVVLPKSDAEANTSPLILVKAQVEKLAAHLITLGVISPNPATMTNQEFAFQQAVELFGLVDAIGKLAQQLAAQNGQNTAQAGLIMLPSESQQALTLLSDLQSILDADSFAALLGNLPKITTVDTALAQQVWQNAQSQQAGGNAQEDIPAGAILVALQFAPTATTQTTNTGGVDTASALPEWLAEAAPQPSQNYARRVTPAPTPATTGIAGGSALRKHLDQQAAQYMQAQRHTLPQNLQTLLQVPPQDSAEYAVWVDQVSQIVHHASFRADLGTATASGTAPTYVFEDPEVTRFLQMMPVGALRDVVRGAGKISRRVAAQDSLIRSHGAVEQTHSESKRLQQQLQPSLASGDRMATMREAASQRLAGEQGAELHQLAQEAVRSSAPTSSAARTMRDRDVSAAPVLSAPTSYSRAAERDVRARGRGRTTGEEVQARNVARAEAKQTEPTGTRFVDQMQYRQVEAEQTRGMMQADQVEAPTQKTDGALLSQAAQAARNQRQLQVARIAQMMRAQITQHVLRQVQNNTDKLELQLNPKRLGKIEVQISREVGGKMAINFAVENVDTLDALKESVESLLQSLREAGINTDGSAMNFTLKEENQQNFEQKRKKSMISDGTEEEAEAMLGLGQQAEIDDDGRVNVRV